MVDTLAQFRNTVTNVDTSTFRTNDRFMNKTNQRTVLITGASRGLGLSLARAFGREGARIGLVARNAAELDRAAATLRSDGTDVVALPFDVGAKEDAYRIAGAAQLALGPVDVLIHNASTLGPVPLRPLALGECEDFAAVLETNVLGPFRLTKALLPSLTRPDANAPALVFISSDASVSAYPDWGFYGVSKAALDHLARSFAAEHPELPVLTVDPGEMDTAMHRAALPHADVATLRKPHDVARAILAALPHAQTGSRFTVEEVSHA